MFCQKCGYENIDDSKFCRECGTALPGTFIAEAGAEKEAVTKEKSGNNSKIIVAAAIVVVCFLGAIVFFGSGSRNTIKSKNLLSASKADYKAGDYDNAMLKFQSSDEADYQSEYYMNLCYKVAVGWYEDGQYAEALEWYDKINASKCSFDDIDERVLEAKYGFVKDNFYTYNETTYKYLKTLKEEGYRDSVGLYDDLYTWKVDIVANSSETDTTNDYSSFSKNTKIYFHVKLTGGTPNQILGLKYSIRYPNGSFNEGSWDGNFKNGNTPIVWANTSSTGTLIVSIYDFSNKFLGSKSVTVTSY